MEILLYLLKFNLHLIIPEKLMNFKLNTISDNSLYIKFCFIKKCNQTHKYKKIATESTFLN